MIEVKCPNCDGYSEFDENRPFLSRPTSPSRSG